MIPIASSLLLVYAVKIPPRLHYYVQAIPSYVLSQQSKADVIIKSISQIPHLVLTRENSTEILVNP